MPDFDRIQRLGSGAFGEVWLVFDRALGVQRAVKYIRRGRIHDPTDLYCEPKALMKLRHEHVVRVEDAGTTADGSLYIAMEYHPRGSLKDKYEGQPAPLTRVRKLLCDVCWALEYAHQLGYVHRDIKPANILLGSNGVGKLSDFGLATRAPLGSSASPYGYLTHLAPEVFRADATNHLTDIYALGVTAYRLVNGDGFLPDIADWDELPDMIIAGTYPNRNHYRPYVPVALKRLVNKAIHLDPDRRYASAAVFRQDLEQLPINCDWKWKRTLDAIRYRTRIGDVTIRTEVERSFNRRFHICTTKSVAGGPITSRYQGLCERLAIGANESLLAKDTLAICNGRKVICATTLDWLAVRSGRHTRAPHLSMPFALFSRTVFQKSLR